MTAKNWYALYTKSRHEKSISAELAKHNIESFLPVRRIKKRWSDRTVTVDEPLFRSYLFVKTDRSEAQKVLRSKGAVKFVSTRNEFISVDEQVIASLRSLISHEIAIDPFPYLDAGDKVSVRRGIFKGIEGFVVRKDSQRCRLVISITAIMASIAIEVDADAVEKI